MSHAKRLQMFVQSKRSLFAIAAMCAAACGVSESQVDRVEASGAGGTTGPDSAGGSNALNGSRGGGTFQVGGSSQGSAQGYGGSSGSRAYNSSGGASGASPVGTSGTGGAGALSGARGGGAPVGTGSSDRPGSADGSNAESPPSAGLCPTDSTLTLGGHISFAVTWSATTAASASSGSQTAHVRWLAKYTVNGNKLTGTQQTCSLSLPDVQLSAIGAIAAGGTKVQIEIPPSVWAQPSMPKFSGSATMSGWDPPSTIESAPGIALVGINLPASADPETLKWPSSSWSFPSGTTFTDSDGDSNPGVTAKPLNGNSYVYPPTAVGLGGLAPAADEVYIVSRNRIGFSGKWTSCTDLSGTATVTIFENHVVGCRVHDGSACTTSAANSQADFIDQNRTVYTPGSATFVAKKLGNDASCADVLAALP